MKNEGDKNLHGWGRSYALAFTGKGRGVLLKITSDHQWRGRLVEKSSSSFPALISTLLDHIRFSVKPLPIVISTQKAKEREGERRGELTMLRTPRPSQPCQPHRGFPMNKTINMIMYRMPIWLLHSDLWLGFEIGCSESDLDARSFLEVGRFYSFWQITYMSLQNREPWGQFTNRIISTVYKSFFISLLNIMILRVRFYMKNCVLNHRNCLMYLKDLSSRCTFLVWRSESFNRWSDRSTLGQVMQQKSFSSNKSNSSSFGALKLLYMSLFVVMLPHQQEISHRSL